MMTLETRLRERYPDWVMAGSVMLQGSPGWHPMLDLLLEHIDEALPWNVSARFRLSLARPKFGQLQVMWRVVPWDACPDSLNRLVRELIDHAVATSRVTCQYCGEPGEIDRFDEPVKTLCATCRAHRDDHVIDEWNQRATAAGDAHRIINTGSGWALVERLASRDDRSIAVFGNVNPHVAVMRAKSHVAAPATESAARATRSVS